MLVDSLTTAYMRYNGFLQHRTTLRSTLAIFPPRPASLLIRHISPAPDLSYWCRPHTSKTRLPILFIHGIGIGLLPYTRWLHEINAHDPLSATGEDGEIGILAIELLPISFRITSTLPRPDVLVPQIAAILDHHNLDKVVLASHSYGTILTRHLLNSPLTAPKIGPTLLIDPIPFLLHLPDVAYNFTARRPRGANEHQLWYFACTDMMVSHTLARGFFWAENVLWKEDLRGRDVTVSLAGRDLIVDTEAVGRYVNGVDLKGEERAWRDKEWTGTGMESLWFGTADHAQVFERADGRRRLANVIREYVKRTDEEGVGEELA